MDQEPKNDESKQSDSLEAPEKIEEQAPAATPAPSGSIVPDQSPLPDDSSPPTPAAKPKSDNKLLNKIKFINVYLLIFLLVIVMAIIIAFVAYQKNRQGQPESPSGPSSQAINEDVLNQLRNTDVTIGDPKQILNVEANAVFAGSVLVRGDFETAGQIRSEGPISASGVNVSGTGTFQTVQTSKLQLAGDSQIQGNLTVQNSLSVSGSGNFGGTLSANKLSIQSLELAGNLTVTRHIDGSGGNPSKSSGSALGGGGTSSVSGSDTAGTININTGSSPHAGCFIKVNFTRSFSKPHVVVTPVGASAAGINYYVTRSGSNFSLCTSSAAPAGKNFSFDYIVID